ncbi:hypothetical protein I550_3289 [Mycobacterium intracellulare 1956]|uniref:Uncharacterized protein n=1 Tax=Mycobacterium intracellulare 1956 TaxID=1299331 RepID=X8CI76_MYCIT|nr:hypothetical protein L843_3444 [Mycobacterium intracellulare MIN_061107_1834]EUA32230.1 hypothetical protein I548_1004 [Mycobacterium intracellulare]EUA55138.1 hypothetical protein I550_3289 [Mycobacterium intracellulare 1956]
MTAGGALLLDVSRGESHMATHNAMKTITAAIAMCVGRGFNEAARTDSSPSHVRRRGQSPPAGAVFARARRR